MVTGRLARVEILGWSWTDPVSGARPPDFRMIKNGESSVGSIVLSLVVTKWLNW